MVCGHSQVRAFHPRVANGKNPVKHQPPIHVVLHGGLGNQLFQLFKACLLADERPRRRIHLHVDRLSGYSTARGFELQHFVERDAPDAPVVTPIDVLCRLRVPKLIDRITGHQPIIRSPNGASIVDGYFQSVAQYRHHEPRLMQARLLEWRNWLRAIELITVPQRSQLVHIRLGDFHASRQHAREFAIKRLAMAEAGADVISDDESLIEEAIALLKRRHGLRILPTANMDAWSVLKFMSGYESINTNGSTLAFWAAILAGATLQSTEDGHMAVFSLLRPADIKRPKRPGE